jgi:hypothetical protein
MAPPDQIIGRVLTETIRFRWCLDDRFGAGGAIKRALGTAGAGAEATGSTRREAIAETALAGPRKGATLLLTSWPGGATGRTGTAGATGEAIRWRPIAEWTLSTGTIPEGTGCGAAIGQRTGRGAAISAAAVSEGGAIATAGSIGSRGAVSGAAGAKGRTGPEGRSVAERRPIAKGGTIPTRAPGREWPVSGGTLTTGTGAEGPISGATTIAEGAALWAARALAPFTRRAVFGAATPIRAVAARTGGAETGRLARSTTCATPGSLFWTTVKTGAHAQAGNGSGINRADLGLYQLI